MVKSSIETSAGYTYGAVVQINLVSEDDKGEVVGVTGAGLRDVA